MATGTQNVPTIAKFTTPLVKAVFQDDGSGCKGTILGGITVAGSGLTIINSGGMIAGRIVNLICFSGATVLK